MLDRLIALMSLPVAAPDLGKRRPPFGPQVKVEGLRHYLFQTLDVDGVPTQGQWKPGPLKVRLPFRRA